MLTDREIVAAMQEANPLPEPEMLPDDPAGFDILLDKISERRVPMLSTPDIKKDKPIDIPPPKRGWNRKPLVVMASFIVILLAVGIGAMIFVGGGSDTATPPAPTSPSFPQTTAMPPESPLGAGPLPAFTPGVFVTYGVDQGVPDGCAYSIAFAGPDTYVAGECGLLHFDGTTWRHLAELPYPNYTLDLAVAPDGTVWVANVDTDVLQWTGQELVEYDLRASEIEVTPDGTVWAVQYARWENPDEIDKVEALKRLDGADWVLENEAVKSELALDPDGTLWAEERQWQVIDGFNTSYPVLKSFNGTSWTTHPTPDNSFLAGFAADGSAILVDGGRDAFVVRDGDQWTTYKVPTFDEFGIPARIDEKGEPIDFLGLRGPTITEDGTLWVHSSSYYGAFSFDGHEWARYTTEEGLASNRLLFVEIGPDGSLWFGTEDAGVTRYLPEQ